MHLNNGSTRALTAVVTRASGKTQTTNVIRWPYVADILRISKPHKRQIQASLLLDIFQDQEITSSDYIPPSILRMAGFTRTLASATALLTTLVLLATPARACGVNDQQYLTGSFTYTTPGGDCPPRTINALPRPSAANIGNQPPSAVESQCKSICDSSFSDCASVYITRSFGPRTPTSSDGNFWACDFYRTGVKPVPNTACFSNNPLEVYEVYKETINSCFASTSSTAAASAYCSDYLLSDPPSQATVYATTVTEGPSAATETSTSTVFRTSNAIITSTVFGGTRSSTRVGTSTSGQTTTSVSTVTVIRTTTVPDVLVPKASTVTVVTTSSVTSTQSVCSAVSSRIARDALLVNNAAILGRAQLPQFQPRSPGDLFRRAAAPACLSQGGEATGADVISSACSCLYAATVTASVTTTVIQSTSTSFAQAFVTSSVVSTSFVQTTSYATVTVNNLVVVTVPTTIVNPTTTIITKITTTFVPTQLTTVKSTRTTTVTTQVQKTTVPTFALYARPANKKGDGPDGKKFRLLTRILGSETSPQNRIIQYRKPKSAAANTPDWVGVNATIIDGYLYIINQQANPKLFGFSLALGSGRTVLGNSGGDDATALRGCAIDVTTKVLDCKLPSGDNAKFQELKWPTGGDGRFMLAQIPKGKAGDKEYKPVMQLLAGEAGTVQLGCQ